MSHDYSTLPSSSSRTLEAKPFKLAIPNDALEEFRTLLKLSKIGPVTYESLQTDGNWGISREWLENAKKHWLEGFDWRAKEKYINSFPQYKTTVKDDDGHELELHFVALFSKKSDAIPIVYSHGWPGSFLEFIPTLELLRSRYTPETLPYHIIVPSLPGYTLSSGPPLDRDFNTTDIARIIHKLLVGLGFTAYVAQGGDIGSKISRILGASYEECKAVHINFCFMPEPKDVDQAAISEQEKKGMLRTEEFITSGRSYAWQHATKPSTIGLALAASPLALLAWIGEKFIAWSDETPSLDTILENVTLYWLTETMARCIYPYREKSLGPGKKEVHATEKFHIEKPLGYSWFPRELAPVPRCWVETTGNLVFYRAHESGGHFAALEKPEALFEDLEAFVKQVWK